MICPLSNEVSDISPFRKFTTKTTRVPCKRGLRARREFTISMAFVDFMNCNCIAKCTAFGINEYCSENVWQLWQHSWYLKMYGNCGNTHGICDQGMAFVAKLKNTAWQNVRHSDIFEKELAICRDPVWKPVSRSAIRKTPLCKWGVSN